MNFRLGPEVELPEGGAFLKTSSMHVSSKRPRLEYRLSIKASEQTHYDRRCISISLAWVGESDNIQDNLRSNDVMFKNKYEELIEENWILTFKLQQLNGGLSLLLKSDDSITWNRRHVPYLVGRYIPDKAVDASQWPPDGRRHLSKKRFQKRN